MGFIGAKTTTTTQSNNHQFMAQPKNENYEAGKKLLDNLDFSTPITQAYGRQRNEIMESGNEIFGANTSPEMAQKVRENRLFRSTVDHGRDLSNAVQQENNAKIGGYMSLGDATKAQLVNSGGTSTQKTPFDWAGTLIGGANAGANVATAA